jgi:hypothetical protein
MEIVFLLARASMRVGAAKPSLIREDHAQRATDMTLPSTARRHLGPRRPIAVPFGVLIFTAFMSGIPREVTNAALIDGAST